MPGAQGAEQWTAGGRNRTVLIDERRLPFAAGTFDRILLVHALEEADDPKALLTEAVRALAPSGRVILAAAARGGLWARAEATPSAMAAPSPAASWSGWCARSAWSRSPGPRRCTSPWRPLLGLADGLEQVGPKLFPGAAGLIMLEATRQAYARVRPRGLAQTVLAGRPALTPRPPPVITRLRRTLWAPRANSLKASLMQRLILMRHAKAEASAPGGDVDRALSERGLRDAAAIGRALAARGLKPDMALVSAPGARARPGIRSATISATSNCAFRTASTTPRPTPCAAPSRRPRTRRAACC